MAEVLIGLRGSLQNPSNFRNTLGVSNQYARESAENSRAVRKEEIGGTKHPRKGRQTIPLHARVG
jgi:hypothetical protein